jgi:hypothetical protein
MVDGAFGQLDVDEPAEGTWRQRLRGWAEIELAGYRQFSWIMRVPVMGAPIMPNQLRFMEWGLRTLGDTRLEEHEKLSSILLITSFTRSFALLSGDLAEAFEAGAPLSDVTGYGTMIKRLTTEEEFPALHAVVRSGAFEEAESGLEELDYDFHFGIDRILDGIEALVRIRD